MIPINWCPHFRNGHLVIAATPPEEDEKQAPRIKTQDPFTQEGDPRHEALERQAEEMASQIQQKLRQLHRPYGSKPESDGAIFSTAQWDVGDKAPVQITYHFHKKNFCPRDNCSAYRLYTPFAGHSQLNKVRDYAHARNFHLFEGWLDIPDESRDLAISKTWATAFSGKTRRFLGRPIDGVIGGALKTTNPEMYTASLLHEIGHLELGHPNNILYHALPSVRKRHEHEAWVRGHYLAKGLGIPFTDDMCKYAWACESTYHLNDTDPQYIEAKKNPWNCSGCEYCDGSHKTAANTKAWYLRNRDKILAETGPPQTKTLHRFSDGWTVKQLVSKGDHYYEGKLNENCIKDYGRPDSCHTCGGEGKALCNTCGGSGYMRHPKCQGRGCNACGYSGYKRSESCQKCKGAGYTNKECKDCNGTGERGFDSPVDGEELGYTYVGSLRDPDNIPHLSFAYDEYKKDITFNSVNGRGNTEPKPEHQMRFLKFAAKCLKDTGAETVNIDTPDNYYIHFTLSDIARRVREENRPPQYYYHRIWNDNRGLNFLPENETEFRHSIKHDLRLKNGPKSYQVCRTPFEHLRPFMAYSPFGGWDVNDPYGVERASREHAEPMAWPDVVKQFGKAKTADRMTRKHRLLLEPVGEMGGINYHRVACKCGWNFLDMKTGKKGILSEKAAQNAWQRHFDFNDTKGYEEKFMPPMDKEFFDQPVPRRFQGGTDETNRVRKFFLSPESGFGGDNQTVPCFWCSKPLAENDIQGHTLQPQLRQTPSRKNSVPGCNDCRYRRKVGEEMVGRMPLPPHLQPTEDISHAEKEVKHRHISDLIPGMEMDEMDRHLGTLAAHMLYQHSDNRATRLDQLMSRPEINISISKGFNAAMNWHDEGHQQGDWHPEGIWRSEEFGLYHKPELMEKRVEAAISKEAEHTGEGKNPGIDKSEIKEEETPDEKEEQAELIMEQRMMKFRRNPVDLWGSPPMIG